MFVWDLRWHVKYLINLNKYNLIMPIHDVLKIHTLELVHWHELRMLSGILTQNVPIITTQELSSFLCKTEEVQNHWILVSEKPIQKTDIPIKYVCHKQIPKRGVLSPKPLLGNTFHWKLGQLQKDLVFQLPQSATNLCKNQLSCNLHDKNMRNGSLQSSVLIISIAHKNNFQSTGFHSIFPLFQFYPNYRLRSYIGEDVLLNPMCGVGFCISPSWRAWIFHFVLQTC